MQILQLTDVRRSSPGIDAPSPTAELEERPAWLTPVERKVLSEIPGGPERRYRLGVVWYDDEPASDPSGVKVCLLTANLEGLRSAIAEALTQAFGRHNAQLEQAVLVADWVYYRSEPSAADRAPTAELSWG